MRAEPDDAAEQVTQALRGEPLTVEEERREWSRIRTAYGYPGWIRTVSLGRVPGTGPGPWPGGPCPDADSVGERRERGCASGETTRVRGTVPPTWLPEPRPDGDPVAEARAYLGSPYEWGGMTERGIDCSGLVHMAYRRVGRLVPRDADQQEQVGRPLAEPDLGRGDLITYGEERAIHIAFWLGEGRILHSTEREDANGVLEEPEPADLAARRRKLLRL